MRFEARTTVSVEADLTEGRIYVDGVIVGGVLIPPEDRGELLVKNSILYALGRGLRDFHKHLHAAWIAD